MLLLHRFSHGINGQFLITSQEKGIDMNLQFESGPLSIYWVSTDKSPSDRSLFEDATFAGVYLDVSYISS